MKVRTICGAAAALALASATAIIPSLPAAATPMSVGSGPGQNLSSVASPSWQTSDTVWSIAATGGNVYVGGQFTSVRPPGVALGGTGQVAQAYLAEFSGSTGNLVTSFAPTLNGLVHAVAVSPNGSTLYVGGSFTTVNGLTREHLAAFSTATGALISTWDPTTNNEVLGLTVSPDGSTLYVGGDFTKIDAQARSYAGAVPTSGSGTTPTAWAPVLDNSVTSIAVAPDNSQVVLGGYFTTIDGVTQQAAGAVAPSPNNGQTALTWNANIVPNNDFNGGCVSQVKDVIIGSVTPSDPAGVAYLAAEGTGGGCFDGDFAVQLTEGNANPSQDDPLVWQNVCLGATQAIAIVNGLLYKGSHAHDCAYEPDGFPQQPTSDAYHLLAQSLTDGTVQHWTPSTNAGSGGLGPRAMATDGTQLFVGGDFTQVNGVNQQGFTIFGPGPDTTKPTYPAAPTVISTSAGVDSVTIQSVSDTADGTLTYNLYRDSGKTPIATLTATSWPWALPILQYRDAGLTPGSQHTYQVSVSNGVNTTAKSAASAAVTVSGTSPTLTYPQTVLNDGPSFFWPLNETSGTTATDASPNGFNGTYEPGTTQGVPGPISDGTNTPTNDTATAFDGQSGLVTSANQVPSPGPQTFSIELWFKTTTEEGGKLIGFGSNQTGMSSSYDRHIYMMNDGQLVFGVWTGSASVIETPDVYNDGQWHYVVATIGASGMALYVDGQLVGTNSNTTVQNYAGYWRVGGDNLNGWNLDEWGANSQGFTEPNSYYFNGDMADVAVYPTALSAAQVATHYAANSLSH